MRRVAELGLLAALAALLSGAGGGPQELLIALEIAPPPEAPDLPPQAVSLLGFRAPDLAFTGLPRVGSRPTFEAAVGARGWPARAELPVPADGRTRLVSWLDLDANGLVSTGDWVSRPADPLLVLPGSPEQPALPLALPLERLWVAAGAPPTDAPLVDIPLQLSIAGHLRAGRGDLLLLGFLPGDLRGGMPARGVRPRTTARISRKRGPLVLRASPGLTVVPVLDENGDGRMGPGDLVGPASTLRAEGTSLSIDRALRPPRSGCGP